MLKDANLAASGIQLFQRSHLTPDASSAGDIYDPNLYNPSSTERCRGLALDEERKKNRSGPLWRRSDAHVPTGARLTCRWAVQRSRGGGGGALISCPAVIGCRGDSAVKGCTQTSQILSSVWFSSTPTLFPQPSYFSCSRQWTLSEDAGSCLRSAGQTGGECLAGFLLLCRHPGLVHQITVPPRTRVHVSDCWLSQDQTSAFYTESSRV